MKNSKIISAYDSIRPTEAQKQKMLEAILKEAEFDARPGKQKKRGSIVYTAPPSKFSRRSIFATIAASLAIMAVSAAMLVLMIRQTDDPAYAAPTQSSAPELVFPADPTHYGIYNAIISDYVGYLNGTLENPTSIPKKLRTFLDSRDTSGLGWIVYDVNGDGTEEMLISDGDWIYQAMTMDEESKEVPILFTAMEEEQYYRCQDEIFCKVSDYGNDYVQYDFFKAGTNYPGYQELLEVVICDKGEFRIGKTEETAVSVEKSTGDWTLGEKYLREYLVVTPFDREPVPELPDLNLTGFEPYDSILKKYHQSVQQRWNASYYSMHDLSMMIAEDDAHGELGWCTMDIDSNGSDDLVIGTSEWIYDIYCTGAEGIKQLAVARAGTRYALCQDGYLSASQLQGDELPWSVYYYSIQDGDLVSEVDISCIEGQHYRGASNGIRQPISKDQAASIMASYPSKSPPLQMFDPETAGIRRLSGIAEYDPVLRLYAQAAAEQWDTVKLEQNGLSAMVAQDGAWLDLGWCLLDIDINGREELLIFKGERIYDSYTITAGGELAPLMRASFEKTLTLCQNGIFRAVYPNEGRTVYSYHKVTDEFTAPEKTVIYENGAYRAGQTEVSAQPVSKDEAGRIMAEYIELELFPTRFIPVPEDVYNTDATYAPVLQKYRKALTEKWDYGKCEFQGIAGLVANYVNEPGKIGYTFLNLNGGEEEMIVTDGESILALYTVEKGEVIHVISGFERKRFTLTEGKKILCHGSNSAAESFYTLFSLPLAGTFDGATLKVEEGYVFDAIADPEDPWFFSSGDGSQGDPCGDFDVEARLKELAPMELSFRRFN